MKPPETRKRRPAPPHPVHQPLPAPIAAHLPFGKEAAANPKLGGISRGGVGVLGPLSPWGSSPFYAWGGLALTRATAKLPPSTLSKKLGKSSRVAALGRRVGVRRLRFLALRGGCKAPLRGCICTLEVFRTPVVIPLDACCASISPRRCSSSFPSAAKRVGKGGAALPRTLLVYGERRVLDQGRVGWRHEWASLVCGRNSTFLSAAVGNITYLGWFSFASTK